MPGADDGFRERLLVALRDQGGLADLRGTMSAGVDLSNPPLFPLTTNRHMWDLRRVFYRNYEMDSSIAAQQLAMNIIGYLLVRFDRDLLLAPQ